MKKRNEMGLKTINFVFGFRWSGVDVVFYMQTFVVRTLVFIIDWYQV